MNINLNVDSNQENLSRLMRRALLVDDFNALNKDWGSTRNNRTGGSGFRDKL